MSARFAIVHLDRLKAARQSAIIGGMAVSETLLESESRRLKTRLHGSSASARFRFMIEDLAASNPDNKMVLLVDEYDRLRRGWACSIITE